VRERTGAAVGLTGALAVAAAVSAGVSLLRPSVLRGVAVTDGNLRGTALVVLAVGVPLLLEGARRARRGSVPGLVLWLAAAMYLTYQAVLFCFATPMNRLFPAYVAMLSLAMATAVSLARAVDVEAVAPRLVRGRRVVPLVLGVSATLNALAWLGRALPIVWTGRPPAAVTDSGLATSPVLVQDLAFWLPLSLLVAVLALRGHPWGAVLSSALVSFYAVEALGVASDQWWGVRADPDHPAVASLAAVPTGIALALALAAVMAWSLRRTIAADPHRGRR
jgi:hypothetical protein